MGHTTLSITRDLIIPGVFSLKEMVQSPTTAILQAQNSSYKASHTVKSVAIQ